MTDDPNAAQREYWNTRRAWIDHQDGMDRQLDASGRAAMATLGDLSARRVLDVGCGCGHTSLQLADAVGAEGLVVGLDISVPMTGVAADRARAAGCEHLSFVAADAQTVDPGGPYDAVFSRFGVMFFSDPAAAFANLRSAVVAGGQLAFVCWQPVSENPWMTTPNRAAMSIIEFPPRGESAADPFAFGDPDFVRVILHEAGWTDVEIVPHVIDVAMGGGGSIDDAVELMIELGPAKAALEDQPESTRNKVRAAMAEALAPYERDGGVWLTGSTWLVTATA